MHLRKKQQKLIHRVRRIRGQLDAVERGLTEDASCADILQQATACRGALEGLIAEVIEDHIREHLMKDGATPEQRIEASEELVEIVHSYLRR